MLNALVSSALTASLLLTPVYGGGVTVAGQAGQLAENPKILASETLDLSNRYPVASVSEGFKENILIAVGYFYIDNPSGMILKPGEIFAFHKKGLLPEFKDKITVSQDSDFTTNTGYKVVAGLGGNGVCHLASLMNLAASKSGLEVVSPTNHNFAKIPGIDAKFGTSISTRNSPENQNLYIKNNFDFPVRLQFSLEGNQLGLAVVANR